MTQWWVGNPGTETSLLRTISSRQASPSRRLSDEGAESVTGRPGQIAATIEVAGDVSVAHHCGGAARRRRWVTDEKAIAAVHVFPARTSGHGRADRRATKGDPVIAARIRRAGRATAARGCTTRRPQGGRRPARSGRSAAAARAPWAGRGAGCATTGRPSRPVGEKKGSASATRSRCSRHPQHQHPTRFRSEIHAAPPPST
jgi:hypothetical protein